MDTESLVHLNLFYVGVHSLEKVPKIIWLFGACSFTKILNWKKDTFLFSAVSLIDINGPGKKLNHPIRFPPPPSVMAPSVPTMTTSPSQQHIMSTILPTSSSLQMDLQNLSLGESWGKSFLLIKECVFCFCIAIQLEFSSEKKTKYHNMRRSVVVMKVYTVPRDLKIRNIRKFG